MFQGRFPKFDLVGTDDVVGFIHGFECFSCGQTLTGTVWSERRVYHVAPNFSGNYLNIMLCLRMLDKVEEDIRLSRFFRDSGVLGGVLDTSFLCSGKHTEAGFMIV